ncbi:MAG: hypothetical protein JWO93_438 [Micrococcaceae bacterium]|jgi:hypothetical protein|nr:hypothetical protein [Micrococcaceae bacterium]
MVDEMPVGTVRPQRVLVQAPQAQAAAVRGGFAVSREVAEQTAVGEVFLSALIRSQLRLALVVAGGFLVLLLGIPLLLTALPAAAGVTVLGVPMRWLLLGVAVYPLLLLCAWLFVRSATRNEVRYRELVDEK